MTKKCISTSQEQVFKYFFYILLHDQKCISTSQEQVFAYQYWQIPGDHEANDEMTFYLHSRKKELGGGATLDLGVYCVQFASLVMGGERPQKVVAAGHLSEEVRNFALFFLSVPVCVSS